eukprot:gene8322-5833_t
MKGRGGLRLHLHSFNVEPTRSYSVVVITPDSESGDPGSNPGL